MCNFAVGKCIKLWKAELSRAEIREISHRLSYRSGISIFCLFIHSETISEKKPEMVRRAELLLDWRFHQVRIRIHGAIARIEILADDVRKGSDSQQSHSDSFVQRWCRTGSMNETLK